MALIELRVFKSIKYIKPTTLSKSGLHAKL